MTSAQIGPATDELDELRATMTRIAARIAELERPRRRSWRRQVGVLAAAICAGLLVVGVAGAAPTTSTTDVAFVPLSVDHKVLSNTTISANKTDSVVVSGGSTTVPTTATTVRVSVTAKGSKSGVLNFYPAGNVSGGSGQFLPYPAGNTAVSATIEENVGESNKLTFANTGAGSVVVTAVLTGWSTQVTAGDIGGTGGTTGQVLTNNGAGGASWHDPGGPAYAASVPYVQPITTSGNTVATLTVPAGSYFVTFDSSVDSPVADYVQCSLLTPLASLGSPFTSTPGGSFSFGEVSAEGLITTTGIETITATCRDGSSSMTANWTHLVAIRVASTQGAVNSSRPGIQIHR